MSDQPQADDDRREDREPEPEEPAGAEAPDRDAGEGPVHPGAA